MASFAVGCRNCSSSSSSSNVVSFSLSGFPRFGASRSGLLFDAGFGSILGENGGFRSLGSDCSSKLGVGLFCRSRIGPAGEGIGDYQRDFAGRSGGSNRRRFSLRLRPRLQLLASRVRRVNSVALLNDVGNFLRRNTKRLGLSASVSVLLGLFYLFLKVTAVPSPRVVTYSDLIMSLQSGTVSKVLLEEGSRRIYYNVSSGSHNGDKPGDENTVNSNDISSNEAQSIDGIDAAPFGKAAGVSFSKRFLTA